MIVEGRSFSGNERNCVFLNTGEAAAAKGAPGRARHLAATTFARVAWGAAPAATDRAVGPTVAPPADVGAPSDRVLQVVRNSDALSDELQRVRTVDLVRKGSAFVPGHARPAVAAALFD